MKKIFKLINRKHIAAILIFTMLISLTGCVPQWYTEEEYIEMTTDGNEAVAKWFAENEPTATFSDASVYKDSINYGLSDVFLGEYTLNGETYKYMYVKDADKMYSDRLIEYASQTVARKYADGLGLENYTSVYSNPFTLNIDYTSYYDKKGEGDMKTEKVSHYFGYFLYDKTEEDFDKGIDSILQNKSLYNFTSITYRLDRDHISMEDVNYKFVKDHPYVYDFNIYNKDYTEVVLINMSIDSDEKDVNHRTLIITQGHRKTRMDNIIEDRSRSIKLD